MIINDDYMNSDEISKLLELSGSNVRKYSAALAKSGYDFKTDNKKKRYYTHSDYETLQKLKFLVQHKNLSLEVAANTIVEGLKGTAPLAEHITSIRKMKKITAL
ncbi:MerR family transcriptional regulator (plasmid) [Bacillus megaterium]|nr:MerR family transcriptional regulator [Priestia megaterium]NGY80105.1 MerR family transcriptional regulator [Priestia megaterium]